MNQPQQSGFTLWELLMTMLVAGVLLGIGVPNVMEFQRNAAMTGAANNLVTAILVARAEAVKRQAFVTLCLSDDPLAANPICSLNQVTDSTTRGYFVWVDENNNFDVDGARILIDATDGNGVVDAGELILSRTAAPGGTIRISASCGHVSYLPNGFSRYIGASCAPQPATRNVLFCDDRGRALAAGGQSSARVVRIDRPGRGQVLTEQAIVDPVITSPFGLPLSNVNANCPP